MPKRCKQCKTEIVDPTPWRKPFCSYQCGIQYVRAKDQEKKAKKQRKETREWKEANKTKPQLIKEAHQDGFNPYIRIRDKDKPCISCGRHEWEIPDKYTGGKWDCGHYLSVGSCQELRFHEDNAHKQCKECNGGSGKYARKNRTVREEYRERLIERIGLDRVEWLEGPHQTQNLTHEDIREIKQYYKDKIKVLKGNDNEKT